MNFPSTISNEEIIRLPKIKFEGRIVVVERQKEVERACAEISRHCMVGFDTETRPSFVQGKTYKVSLLQLSARDCCYLFRLNKTGLKRPLLDILASKTIKKVGLDTKGDIRSLKALRRFNPHGFIDLQSIVSKYGICELSLRKLAAIVVGGRLSKAQRLSNWEAAELTESQKVYSATDAWVALEIYRRIDRIEG